MIRVPISTWSGPFLLSWLRVGADYRGRAGVFLLVVAHRWVGCRGIVMRFRLGSSPTPREVRMRGRPLNSSAVIGGSVVDHLLGRETSVVQHELRLANFSSRLASQLVLERWADRLTTARVVGEAVVRRGRHACAEVDRGARRQDQLGTPKVMRFQTLGVDVDGELCYLYCQWVPTTVPY